MRYILCPCVVISWTDPETSTSFMLYFLTCFWNRISWIPIGHNFFGLQIFLIWICSEVFKFCCFLNISFVELRNEKSILLRVRIFMIVNIFRLMQGLRIFFYLKFVTSIPKFLKIPEVRHEYDFIVFIN